MSLQMNGSTRFVRYIGVCYIHDKVQSMSLEMIGSTRFVRYIGVCYIHDKVQSMSEPLPGVLGSRGAWAFIFRDIGRSSNYFQGLREPGFRFWGSREIKGTLIFRFFCSVPGLFTCRKAETDKCFSSLSIYKDNFHEGQLTSLTRAIRSLCVMQCIMGKLKHMARHSQDGGREWRQWSC